MPLAGIADARREVRQLLVGLRLGLGRHPVERVDAAAHRGDDVSDHFVRRLLGLGREMLRDVQLGDVIGQDRCGEVGRALPALLLLRDSRQGGAEECEMLLVERRGQDVRKAVDAADQKLVLEHTDRRLGDQGRNAGDGAWLCDKHVRQVGRSHARKISCEVEARSLLSKFGKRQLVIGLVGVTAFGVGPVHLCDRGFERDDRLGAGRRIGLAGQRQDVGEVLFISCLRLCQLGIGREIIVAVRHAEPALEQVHRIGVGILVILPDKAAEGHADTIAVGLGCKRGIARPRLQLPDLVEPRFDRREPPGLDRRGVEIGAIGSADL